MHKGWCMLTATIAIIGVSLAAAADALAESRKYDPGASDTEIRIGQTMPYSGPLSASSVIGNVQAAYFHMINTAASMGAGST